MNLQTLETLVLVVHVLAAIAIIGLVLIQHGKGADMGSGFGSGTSATVFGSSGAGNFLTKSTTTVAFVFFLTSFGLAYFAKEKSVAARTVGIPEVVQESIASDAESIVIPDLEEVDSGVPQTPAEESEIPEAQ